MWSRWIFIALILCFSKSAYAEYLVDFRMNGRSIGSYIVFEQGKDYYIESSVFEAMGLPVKEDKPLSFFEQYGRINFNPAKQVVIFSPDDPRLFERKTSGNGLKPDKVISNKNGFAVKSLDYQAGYTWNHKDTYSFIGTLTGKIWQFDTDYRFSNTGKANYSLQWHDERGAYIKDIQLGQIQGHNIKGLSLSNEPYARYDSFSAYTHYLYLPLGTRVDIYRNEAFLRTITINRYPHPVEIELFYGENGYKLTYFLPTGEIKEETIIKTVDSFLIPKGQVQYYIAGGNDSVTQNKTYRLRTGYGISNSLTLSGDVNKNGDSFKSLQAYYRLDKNILLNPKLYSDGYGFNAYYYNDLNLSFSYDDRKKWNSVVFVAGVKAPLSPTFSHSLTQQNNIKIARDRLGIYAHFKNLHINPYIENQTIRSAAKTRSEKIGFNSFFILPYGLKTGFNYEIDNVIRKDQYEAFLTKTINKLGDVTFKQTWNNGQRENFEVNANFYNNKYVSISAIGRFNKTGESSFFISLTGSFTPKGIKKDHQAQRAMFYVRPFLDANNNGIYDEGEEIIPATVSIDGRKYTVADTPVLISDLAPYREYTVIANEELDAEPAYKVISVRPNRGDIAVIDIPYNEITEIEGQIKSGEDYKEISLLDETGNIVKKTKTRFGGYYLFRVPAHMKNKLKVIES